MSIGNLDAATLAATHPEAYFFSGEGSSRMVYLIDDVIYKVQGVWYQDNDQELDNANLMRSIMPEGYAIPEMTLYRTDTINVIAMQYIIGEPTGECTGLYLDMPCECPEKGCFEPNDLIELGWCDPSNGNAIWEYETGITYLIDLA